MRRHLWHQSPSAEGMRLLTAGASKDSGRGAGPALPAPGKVPVQQPLTAGPKSRVRRTVCWPCRQTAQAACPGRALALRRRLVAGIGRGSGGRSLLHATRRSGVLEARAVGDGTCSAEGAELGRVGKCVPVRRSVLWFAALGVSAPSSAPKNRVRAASTGRAGRSGAGARLCWTAPPGCARSWAGRSGPPGRPRPASRAASWKPLA